MALIESGGRTQLFVSLGRIYRLEISKVSPEFGSPVSKKHLHRYVSEFEFRWNNRKIDDGKRIVAAIKGAEGKRLIYKEPTNKTA